MWVCLTHHVKKHKGSHEGKNATNLDNDEAYKKAANAGANPGVGGGGGGGGGWAHMEPPLADA